MNTFQVLFDSSMLQQESKHLLENLFIVKRPKVFEIVNVENQSMEALSLIWPQLFLLKIFYSQFFVFFFFSFVLLA